MFHRNEVRGPPSIREWLKCWTIFRTAMLMADAIDLGVLDNYRNKIVRFSETYGPGVWMLL